LIGKRRSFGDEIELIALDEQETTSRIVSQPTKGHLVIVELLDFDCWADDSSGSDSQAIHVLHPFTELELEGYASLAVVQLVPLIRFHHEEFTFSFTQEDETFDPNSVLFVSALNATPGSEICGGFSENSIFVEPCCGLEGKGRPLVVLEQFMTLFCSTDYFLGFSNGWIYAVSVDFLSDPGGIIHFGTPNVLRVSLSPKSKEKDLGGDNFSASLFHQDNIKSVLGCQSNEDSPSNIFRKTDHSILFSSCKKDARRTTTFN
jgi:hypothetical protein